MKRGDNMSYIIIVGSVLILLINYFLKTEKHPTKGMKRLFMFGSYAPVLALGVVLIWLVNSVHTDYFNRLLHAWIAAQFWAASGIAYGCFRLMNTKVGRLFSLISMFLLIGTAVILTPFTRYQHLFSDIPFPLVWTVSLILYLLILLVSQKRVK